MYKARVWKKQRKWRLNCQHSLDHRQSKGIPEKNIDFRVIDYAEVFDHVDHSKLKNYERDGNIRPPVLSPEKSICRSRNNRHS